MASLVLSCDHAVFAVPEWYREKFRGADDVLMSPEGWDPGALNLAQAFAMKTHTPLAHGEVTRLLVDLSRSPEDPKRYSKYVKSLNEEQRRKIHERYFVSYLDQQRDRIRSGIKISPPVVHLSLHTFPRERNGMMVGTDVGVIFDPKRPAEKDLGSRWLTALRAGAPELRFDANRPRESSENGLLALLRKEFADPDYIAVELEVCQSFFLEGQPWRWDRIKKLLIETFPGEPAK
jgi:predicted N-formylglutamate amidohydrolase